MENISCLNLFIFQNCQNNLIENLSITSGKSNSLIYSLNSQVNILNTVLFNYEINLFFQILFKSFFVIFNISYDNNEEIYSMNLCLLISKDSNIILDNVFYNLNNRNLTNNQIISINSNIFVNNCFFSSLFAQQYFFEINKGIFNANNTIMKDFILGMNFKKVSIEIYNCYFLNENNELIFNSQNMIVFNFEDSVNFTLINTLFHNIKSNSSPIHITSCNFINIFNISHCNFNYLTSFDSNGGAMFLSNLKIQIINSTFLNNSAFLNGGAIYLFCSWDQKDLCNYSLRFNIFIKNYANLCGGAYLWQYSRPNESQNTFQDNKAANSQSNYGSFFYRLGFELIEKNNNIEIIIFQSFDLNSTDKLIIRDITQFNENYFFKFYKLDTYNQKIFAINKDILSISLLQSSIIQNTTYENDCNYGHIYGSSSEIEEDKNNFYIFDNFYVKSCPNKTIFLNFNIKFPFPFYVYDIELNNSQNELITNQSTIVIPLLVNNCTIGEIFDKLSLTCVKCRQNYYSFNTNGSSCFLCPENSYCPGGNIIELNPNFWRSSLYSTNIYECEKYLLNCLGGYESMCSQNYDGILCSNCKNNLYKNIMGSCIEC